MALSAARNTPLQGNEPVITFWDVPVAAGAVIYQGGIVCLNAAGFGVPGSTSKSLIALGVAGASANNAAGASGDLVVRVFPGTASLANSASADAVLSTTPLGTPLYIADDQTIALTDGSGTRSYAGCFAGLDASATSTGGNLYETASVASPGVWVTLGYFLGTSGRGVSDAIPDPGTGVAIPVTRSGSIAIVTAAAETNTLAAPTFVGQQLNLCMSVRAVGDRVITSSAAINQAGNTIMTFGAAADMIVLRAMIVAGALVWRVISNDGVALS